VCGARQRDGVEPGVDELGGVDVLEGVELPLLPAPLASICSAIGRRPARLKLARTSSPYLRSPSVACWPSTCSFVWLSTLRSAGGRFWRAIVISPRSTFTFATLPERSYFSLDPNSIWSRRVMFWPCADEPEPVPMEPLAEGEELEPVPMEPLAEGEELEPVPSEPLADGDELEPVSREPLADGEDPELVEPLAEGEELEPVPREPLADGLVDELPLDPYAEPLGVPAPVLPETEPPEVPALALAPAEPFASVDEAEPCGTALVSGPRFGCADAPGALGWFVSARPWTRSVVPDVEPRSVVAAEPCSGDAWPPET
jgi:hypothetical protein